MGNLFFHCPVCEVKRNIEAVLSGIITELVISISSDGTVKSSGKAVTRANHITIYYQCETCGKTIKSANEKKITDEKLLVEYLKQQ